MPDVTERTKSMTWTEHDAAVFAASEEITIETMRADGSFRPPVPIWVVVVDGAVYVRSSHGRDSAWFRGALARHRARVTTWAESRVVDLVEVADVGDALDEAYRAKYAAYRHSFLPRLVGAPAREAALRLEPAEESMLAGAGTTTNTTDTTTH